MKSKALLLLFVFSLSSFTGFGCSLNMQWKESLKNGNGRNCCGQNVHKIIKSDNSLKQNCAVKNNESCCQKTAEPTYVIAKLLPQNNNDNFQPTVADAHNYITYSPILTYQGKSHFKTLLNPPLKKDIRIIIQSFQI